MLSTTTANRAAILPEMSLHQFSPHCLYQNPPETQNVGRVLILAQAGLTLEQGAPCSGW